MNIGFVGLGVMGRPMAGHLIDAGHTVSLNRVRDVSRFLVDKGGIAVKSAADAARCSDLIVLMLPDTPDVEAVLFSEGGIVEGLRPGSLIVDMSSISPVETRRFAERITDAGGAYVDAPVSGGEAGAKNAALSIMVGGSDADVARARPLLEILGQRISHVGPVGDGQTAKVANQIIVGLTIQAVAEAITFAREAGADPEKVRQALLGGFADSTILKVHGERMIERAFDPGFRIRLHHKDIGLATGAARSLGLALPNTAVVEQLMHAAIGAGDSELDHSALVRTVERLSRSASQQQQQ